MSSTDVSAEAVPGRATLPVSFSEGILVAQANSWLIINGGSGPTEDNPTVTLQAPRALDRVSASMTTRRPS